MECTRGTNVPLLLLAATCALAASSPTVAEDTAVVSRILFGSGIKQDHPMPILETIVAERPERFNFLGDNIYADTADMQVMRAKYAKRQAAPRFSKLIHACPILATWDDHDYGIIAIDWNAADPAISLEIRDIDQTVRLRQVLRLVQLQPSRDD